MEQNNSQIQYAIANVEIIRQTIQKSRISLGKFANLFLWFGLTQLIMQLINTFGRTAFIKSSLPVSSLFFLRYLTLFVLFIFYIKLRNNIKKTENLYTMQLFDMWGIILFALPFFRIIFKIIQAVVLRNNTLSFNGLFSMAVVEVIEYTAVMLGIFITGHLIESIILKISSVVFLVIYPLCFLINPIEISIDSALSVYGLFADRNAAAGMIELIAYVMLGIFFKFQSGGEKYGN